MIAEGRPGPSPTAETVHHDSKARDPPLRAPLPVRTGSVKPGPNWMFCAAPPGHLVVPTGETAWGSLPPALPPHGTVQAWARGCRCEECEREYQRFVSELALRGPLRLPAEPEPRKLDADTLARLEPAVSQSECPVCGALRHQRCRNLVFPQHFAPTHPERRSGP